MELSVEENNAAIDKELAERLPFAIKAADIGFWEVDPATHVVKWDGRCQELFGLSKDHYIPYSEAVEHIHPDDVAAVNAAVARALNGENAGLYDMRYRTIGANDGLLRWVHFTGRSYFDENKRPVRFGGIAQDITESQLILQESEARFRNIVEQSPMAIGILRGREMIVELGNDAIFQVWGKTREIV